MSARYYRTASEEETIRLGRELAALLPRRCCVLLVGNLGAGKTTLSKGIVAARTGMSEEEISSPTYTLVHEYAPGVYHIDLYRLETEREVATIGLDELLETGSLLLIEWGERFPTLFPADRVEVHIESDGTDRRIAVVGLPG